MPVMMEVNDLGWRLDNTYATLPATLHAPATPAPVRAPQLILLNRPLARELGLTLDQQPTESVAALLAGQNLPAELHPIAQAYAGHQFGGFTMLGDGRAILLGEHRTPSGKLVDIQLKGAGRTVFSRGGDGLAALGPMLREYIISEAMFALGIPTTRSLAVVATGEPVYRQTVQRGAVLTRVAASHIRVGTFEYVSARRDRQLLQTLADYVIDRHDPALVDVPDKYEAFLRAVVHRQAALIVQWQLVGFIHGVMNTDNMAISGETIDYGPCAFMNAYHADTVFSSIDHGGRYAYGNQPTIAMWNLARFAETLLPLIDDNQQRAIERATSILHEFKSQFDDRWLQGMRSKLGLRSANDDDAELVQSLLAWMQDSRADFTNTFRDLSQDTLPAGCAYQSREFQTWHARWQARRQQEGTAPQELAAAMRRVNPAIIPRNHRVEEALAAAEQQGDFAPLHRLLAALQQPFADDAELATYREPPADESHYRTFCGT
jgi:uncharacterized protein YdiU (UPF0061 family)